MQVRVLLNCLLSNTRLESTICMKFHIIFGGKSVKMWAVLILLFAALLFSGCGSWLVVPYSFQPSYWEFKRLCEINNLPNGEEKYNKILNYIDKSLDDDGFVECSKPNECYLCKRQTERLHTCVNIYYNDNLVKSESDKILTFDTIKDMYLNVSWQSYHIELTGNEGSGNLGVVFDKVLDCKYFLGQNGIDITYGICFKNNEAVPCPVCCYIHKGNSQCFDNPEKMSCDMLLRLKTRGIYE